jgi:hypothetical protein
MKRTIYLFLIYIPVLTVAQDPESESNNRMDIVVTEER